MKRCIKWLISWFIQWVGKLSSEEKIGFFFGAVAGLAIGIMSFVSLDTIPATPMDYQSLEEQAISVQQNPKLLLETDCNINVKGEVITVYFENENCKVTAKYDENLEMLSTSKEDKSVLWVWAILGALVVGIVAYRGGFFVFTIAIYFLELIWQLIYEKLQPNHMKTKRQ